MLSVKSPDRSHRRPENQARQGSSSVLEATEKIITVSMFCNLCYYPVVHRVGQTTWFTKKLKVEAYAPNIEETARHYENKMSFGIKTWVLVVLSLSYQLYDLGQMKHQKGSYSHLQNRDNATYFADTVVRNK